jgi:magnesium-transporting ATPase (P-type)
MNTPIALNDLPLNSSSLLDHKEDHTKMIAFAGRPLTESEKSSTLDPDLNLLLRKFQLLGVASVEYKVSKETCAVVSELRSANIRALMISSKL